MAHAEVEKPINHDASWQGRKWASMPEILLAAEHFPPPQRRVCRPLTCMRLLLDVRHRGGGPGNAFDQPSAVAELDGHAEGLPDVVLAARGEA